jgi:hypothetical protein
MKCVNKKDLIEALDKSAEELHQRIDMHRYLVNTILEQMVSEDSLKSHILSPLYPDQSRLKEAVKEAIEVLEESRKSFKSKRLEALRKKLALVLMESE